MRATNSNYENKRRFEIEKEDPISKNDLFEKYGKGARLVFGMGYKHLDGLGKNLQGRPLPIYQFPRRQPEIPDAILTNTSDYAHHAVPPQRTFKSTPCLDYFRDKKKWKPFKCSLCHVHLRSEAVCQKHKCKSRLGKVKHTKWPFK